MILSFLAMIVRWTGNPHIWYVQQNYCTLMYDSFFFILVMKKLITFESFNMRHKMTDLIFFLNDWWKFILFLFHVVQTANNSLIIYHMNIF